MGKNNIKKVYDLIGIVLTVLGSLYSNKIMLSIGGLALVISEVWLIVK